MAALTVYARNRDRHVACSNATPSLRKPMPTEPTLTDADDAAYQTGETERTFHAEVRAVVIKPESRSCKRLRRIGRSLRPG